MDLKRPLFFISLSVAGLSLTLSFYAARQIPLALSVLLPVVVMLFARKPGISWMVSCSLAGFTALSAVGILLKNPLMPMVLASTAALASWDLSLEIHSRLSYGDSLQNGLYERHHLMSLGAAVGLGLLGACIGQWIHWQISFAGMLLLVFLALFCVGRILDYSQHR